MNESLSGCEKLLGKVQGRMVIEIYLISHTPACRDGPRCGHQSAAVRDEMHMETLFAGRLRLSPNVASRQHFCSNKLSEEDLRGAEARIQNTMMGEAAAGVAAGVGLDKIQDKMICSTCKEETTDWTRLTTILIWQVSAVHTNYHLARYSPPPVHVPPMRSTTLRYITSARRSITRPT